MKNSINALCVLILVVMAISCFETLYSMGHSFASGFEMGYNAADGHIAAEDVVPVGVMVTKNGVPDPSISSELTGNDGQTTQMFWNSGICLVERPRHYLPVAIATVIIYVVVLVFIIRLLVLFIRFIVNVNKGAIFDRRNVVRLDRIGIDLLLIATLNILLGIIQEFTFRGAIPDFNGFSLSVSWSILWFTIILALVVRLAAQIMRKSIMLHEEQSLTI